MAITKVGINGFGRIGRQVLRAIMERQSSQLEVVAINDLADTQTNAHMFKYDTNYGVYPGEVKPQDDSITIDNKKIQVLSSRNPEELNWG